MARFPTTLALFLVLTSCAASPKLPDLAPQAKPVPPTAPKPTAPEFDVALLLRPASTAWMPIPLNEWQTSKNFIARLEHDATHASYAVQVVPVSPTDTIESFGLRVLRNVALSGVETSPLVFAADERSASFYYEAYGSERRGKVFLLRKQGAPVGLVVRSLWPLDAQETTLPDVDAMNAALDYTVKQ